ncbi:NAD(P)H-quinone oxidoreductase [Herbiconiux sp. KACC 21604]|uniref:NAD(P)H-quinone oxidoreductase n=1 Tax=unclassified Herbiconiux TaxID=2618217 RepID=UPI001491CE34|nr:NAD(P)H-quinone oxidoreductase [Herbiconiux sp. SALV-R1]QJU52715.1 NAD(P)H-quinone oxidoreductase [Herbiconiux sp. SALV-R1]WPO87615.1 NAD(P)H-quinone oxidoreductase [Herbiconiux sp. KACC 21604]
MRAVIASRPGLPEVLALVDRPRPVAAPGEVVVRVEAAGVNRADLSQRAGNYPPPPGASDVLGLECAGEIVELGEGVHDRQLGEKVCALLPAGGYAEFVAVPAGQVAPVPAGLSMIEAAAVMETAATVWSNVFWVGRLDRGDTLLVHGGSSGIGTMAIQLAAAAGATVVTTAGTEEKLEACRTLGAALAINYRESDFVAEMRARGLEADVILDLVGASYLRRNVEVLAADGRLVVIGLQGGATAELDLGALLVRRASVTATSLRARPLPEKAMIVRGTVEHVWPLLESGAVRPIVHQTFDLADAAEAHRVLERSDHIGKVVLTP